MGFVLAVAALSGCQWEANVVPTFQLTPLGSANLVAANVVPGPSASAVIGTVVFRWGIGTAPRDSGGWLDYTVTLQHAQGLTGLALYRGTPGSNGTKLHDLMYTGAVFSPNGDSTFTMWSNVQFVEMKYLGKVQSIDTILALLAQQQLYVQATTQAFPTGAARGTVGQ
jgi:hypothetical protein